MTTDIPIFPQRPKMHMTTDVYESDGCAVSFPQDQNFSLWKWEKLNKKWKNQNIKKVTNWKFLVHMSIP